MYDPDLVKIMLELPIMPKSMSITRLAKKFIEELKGHPDAEALENAKVFAKSIIK